MSRVSVLLRTRSGLVSTPAQQPLVISTGLYFIFEDDIQRNSTQWIHFQQKEVRIYHLGNKKAFFFSCLYADQVNDYSIQNSSISIMPSTKGNTSK